MQPLKIEHKDKIEKKKDRREGKGKVLAISRRIYRLQKTDVFYVESESSDNTYYLVKYQPSDFKWCSCRDNSTRGLKCKHIWSIEFAIKMGTLKDTDKLLSADAKRDTSILVSPTAPQSKQIAIEAKSYTDDDYSF